MGVKWGETVMNDSRTGGNPFPMISTTSSTTQPVDSAAIRFGGWWWPKRRKNDGGVTYNRDTHHCELRGNVNADTLTLKADTEEVDVMRGARVCGTLRTPLAVNVAVQNGAKTEDIESGGSVWVNQAEVRDVSAHTYAWISGWARDVTAEGNAYVFGPARHVKAGRNGLVTGRVESVTAGGSLVVSPDGEVPGKATAGVAAKLSGRVADVVMTGNKALAILGSRWRLPANVHFEQSGGRLILPEGLAADQFDRSILSGEKPTLYLPKRSAKAAG